jgi:hypothetical protein
MPLSLSTLKKKKRVFAYSTRHPAYLPTQPKQDQQTKHLLKPYPSSVALERKRRKRARKFVCLSTPESPSCVHPLAKIPSSKAHVINLLSKKPKIIQYAGLQRWFAQCVVVVVVSLLLLYGKYHLNDVCVISFSVLFSLLS